MSPVAGGARQIVVSETAGESRYKALNLTLEKATGDDTWGYLFTYTLSELTNNTDDIDFRARELEPFRGRVGPVGQRPAPCHLDGAVPVPVRFADGGARRPVRVRPAGQPDSGCRHLWHDRLER
ncbi:MAG: hypothetical protein U5K38_16535 [Woeseiaceae bacterium]|nr:hypothetical protein [Woeseiaceae bacterium]